MYFLHREKKKKSFYFLPIFNLIFLSGKKVLLTFKADNLKSKCIV